MYDIVWYLCTSVSIAIVSSISTRGEVYAMLFYMIKFVRDFFFAPSTLVSSVNKNDQHRIARILVKVVLNIHKTN